jgi:hypothetical protein
MAFTRHRTELGILAGPRVRERIPWRLSDRQTFRAQASRKPTRAAASCDHCRTRRRVPSRLWHRAHGPRSEDRQLLYERKEDVRDRCLDFRFVTVLPRPRNLPTRPRPPENGLVYLFISKRISTETYCVNLLGRCICTNTERISARQTVANRNWDRRLFQCMHRNLGTVLICLTLASDLKEPAVIKNFRKARIGRRWSHRRTVGRRTYKASFLVLGCARVRAAYVDHENPLHSQG